MSTSFFSKAVLLLCSVHLATANIMHPKKGDSVELNKEYEVKWDTEGLEAPLKMHLAPGGATDLSTIISELNRKPSSARIQHGRTFANQKH